MSDKDDDIKDLHTVRQDLAEMRGRPFDVDEILAKNRAKQEQAKKEEKTAKDKLEETVRVARERRHTLRAAGVVREAEELEEKRMEFERAKRTFDKLRERKPVENAADTREKQRVEKPQSARKSDSNREPGGRD